MLSEVLVRLFAPQNLSGSWTEISDWGYYMNRAGAKVRHQFNNRIVTYRFNDGYFVRTGTADFKIINLRLDFQN